MSKKLRVVVTGAGSGVGQGIIKSLKISSLKPTVIAADIHPLHAGLYRTDEAMLIPRVEEKNALSRMLTSLKKIKADAVMVGSEFDLAFFSKHKAVIEKKTGAFVFASSPKTIQIADDKHATSIFLKENNLPHAESAAPKNLQEAQKIAKKWGFPVIAKPRSGTSSRHVYLVKDEPMLKAVFNKIPKPMIQKVISKPESELANEYTCSVFKCRDGSLMGPFTARRTLKTGHSWVIEVKPFEEFNPLLLAIASKLDVLGSINVQLMKNGKGGVPFEFNARFSGTTAVRAHFGFNEPDMALRNYILGETLQQPKIRKGVSFRYSEEVFVDNHSAAELEVSHARGTKENWF